MGTEKFTAEAGAKMVYTHLDDLGFQPRDADPTDLQRDGDQTLRFKVGTAYQEVTVQVIVDGKAQVPLRATSWPGIDRMLIEIHGLVDRHDRTPEGRR